MSEETDGPLSAKNPSKAEIIIGIIFSVACVGFLVGSAIGFLGGGWLLSVSLMTGTCLVISQTSALLDFKELAYSASAMTLSIPIAYWFISSALMQ